MVYIWRNKRLWEVETLLLKDSWTDSLTLSPTIKAAASKASGSHMEFIV